MSNLVTLDQAQPHLVLELRRTVRADRAGEDIGAGMHALYEMAAALDAVVKRSSTAE